MVTNNIKEYECSYIHLLGLENQVLVTPVKKEDFEKYDDEEEALYYHYDPFSLFGAISRKLYTIQEYPSFYLDDSKEADCCFKNALNCKLRNASIAVKGSYGDFAALSKDTCNDASEAACEMNEDGRHFASDWGQFVITHEQEAIFEELMFDENIVASGNTKEHECSWMQSFFLKNQLLVNTVKVEDNDKEEEVQCYHHNPFLFIGKLSRNIMLYTKKLLSAWNIIK